MITVTDIVHANFKGTGKGPLTGTVDKKVRVDLTGKATLHRLAVAVESAGNPALAEKLRGAKKFSMTMTREQWAEMNNVVK